MTLEEAAERFARLGLTTQVTPDLLVVVWSPRSAPEPFAKQGATLIYEGGFSIYLVGIQWAFRVRPPNVEWLETLEAAVERALRYCDEVGAPDVSKER